MKGIKVVTVFFGIMLAGLIFWRRYEVLDLLTSFYGQPTWELLITALIALAVAMLIAFHEYTEWKRDCMRKKRLKAVAKMKKEEKETKKTKPEALNQAEETKKPR